MLSELIIYSGIAVFIGGLLTNHFDHHVEDSPVKNQFTLGVMSFGAGSI